MDRDRAQMHALLPVLLAAVLLALAASGCGGSAGSTAPSGQDGSGGASGGGAAGTDAGGQSGSGAGSAATPQPSSSSPQGPALRVVFVRVGQGDAAVLRSGTWTGLVDGGPSGSEAAVRAALAGLGVRRLDTLVISHQHADHTGGLAALVRQ
ncbi:MAG: MBL fold metallo-hydrolase, partial [Deltaproteobacteria bacterium]